MGHQIRVNERRIAMTNMKLKKLEHITRVEAAAQLTEIAKALRNSGKFELERGGEKLELELDVPENILFELEVEIKDGETELEVEIKWAPVTSPSTSTGAES
jgi:amphi-Trp domain-containing protein